MSDTCGLYYKTITIVIMTIVRDATIWSITYECNWRCQLRLKANVKHIYSTDIIYDRHLWSSKYFYNTGHCTLNVLWECKWHFQNCKNDDHKWQHNLDCHSDDSRGVIYDHNIL
jgi:hypothetical protein